MTVHPEQRSPLPLACTLGPSEGAQRLQQWREMVSRHGTGREEASGQITLRFQGNRGVGDELQRLVAAERSCCPFLGWDLDRAPDGWALRISGDDDALRSLPIG